MEGGRGRNGRGHGLLSSTGRLHRLERVRERAVGCVPGPARPASPDPDPDNTETADRRARKLGHACLATESREAGATVLCSALACDALEHALDVAVVVMSTLLSVLAVLFLVRSLSLRDSAIKSILNALSWLYNALCTSGSVVMSMLTLLSSLGHTLCVTV